MPLPPRVQSSEEARRIADKVDGDLRVAFGVALRVAKLGVKLTVEPKVALMKRVIHAILDDEEPRKP
jgi:hypothetical protein